MGHKGCVIGELGSEDAPWGYNWAGVMKVFDENIGE